MRIAICGTHASGKSTLIEAFLIRHPEFEHEPEPHEVLEELGESFANVPTREDFERQLELNVETLRRYRAGDHVIFERSPFDFLAYLLALDERDAISADHDEWIRTARFALPLLDLIVLVPLDERVRIEVSEDEDLELRENVDEGLHEILIDDQFDLFTDARVEVIEVRGTVEERLAALENACHG